jgi:TetR/AcrR family transcriptional regulator, regulator of cefoperazone and chloramphenicol sensitivity
MAPREDGKETRNRLLNAACEIFAKRGYRNAKVADICKGAGANVASVNYYFGDKANLYAQAWRHAFKRIGETAPETSPDASPEDELRNHVYTLMQNFTEQGALGQFSRLYLMELVNPTGLIQDTWHEMIEPRRQKLLGIIRRIIGEKADNERVLFCEMSIVSQCRTLLTVGRSDLAYLLGQPVDPELIRRLADHITRFSLAGIAAAGSNPVDRNR